MNTDNILKGIATFIIVAAVLAIVGYLWHVVVYVAAAAVLAILGRPLVNYIAKAKIFGWQPSRGVAAAATLMVIWIVVGGLLLLFLPLCINKVFELSNLDWEAITQVMRQSLIDTEAFLESHLHFDVPSLEVMFKDRVVNLFSANLFTDVAGVLFNTLIAFFSISFITFFFLREDGLFYRLVALFFPERYHENVYRALDSITTLLARYFSGLFIESLAIMTVVSVVMMLFGMAVGDALVIGLIMGVMNIVPYAGPVIGGGMSVVIAMLSPIDGDVPYTVLAFVSTIIVVKLIDDFIVQPSLYSERVQAHPLEVFLVILVAGYIGGIVGMILAIPLYTILRVFAREFFSQYSIVRKLTNQMTK